MSAYHELQEVHSGTNIGLSTKDTLDPIILTRDTKEYRLEGKKTEKKFIDLI